VIAGVGRSCDEAGGRCRSAAPRNSPRVSAGSATLNVVTGNNDVNDNNDASVYIPARAVGQRHGPRVGHGVRSSSISSRTAGSTWTSSVAIPRYWRLEVAVSNGDRGGDRVDRTCPGSRTQPGDGPRRRGGRARTGAQAGLPRGVGRTGDGVHPRLYDEAYPPGPPPLGPGAPARDRLAAFDMLAHALFAFADFETAHYLHKECEAPHRRCAARPPVVRSRR
jgi:hypothetical protein